MAELADAYDSGSYERKFLRVQVPFPAPSLKALCIKALSVFYWQRKNYHNKKAGAQPNVMHLPF